MLKLKPVGGIDQTSGGDVPIIKAVGGDKKSAHPRIRDVVLGGGRKGAFVPPDIF